MHTILQPFHSHRPSAPSYRSAWVLVAWLATTAQLVHAQDLPRVEPELVGMSAERLARIDTAMQRYVDRREVAGVVTLVARRGRVVHMSAIGHRDAEAASTMTTDAIFRIASMTKPITSVAAMMLFEEGHFLLSDPIAKWLPEFKDVKVAEFTAGVERTPTPQKLVPADGPITIRHLLTHTAGLANEYRGANQKEYLDKTRGAMTPTTTLGDTVRGMAELPLNHQPGAEWQYGRATDVVGRLVEVISGRSLDEFFRERICGPLAMNDTHFYLPESKLDRFTAVYAPDEQGRIQLSEAPNAESRFVKEPHIYFMAAGGLVSTAADYWRFSQMLLNGGELDGVRLLGRKTVELMTTNHIGELPVWLVGPGFGFGLGFAVVRDVGATAQPWSVGTYTWGGVFCTYFWIDPQEELIGILMAQVRPYAHLNIRQELVVLANQAIVDQRATLSP